MSLFRSFFAPVAAIALLPAISPVPAFGRSYPAKPVRIIVPAASTSPELVAKASQSKDIAAAKRYWEDFREARHGKTQ